MSPARPTQGVERAIRLWEKWDEAVRRGGRPLDLLRGLADEQLVDLLAGAGPGRRYELDLIKTELRNRMHRARVDVEEMAERAEAVVDRLHKAVEMARDEVHETELRVAGHMAEEHGETVTAETQQAMSGSFTVEAMNQAVKEVDELRDRAVRAKEATQPPRRDGDGI